MRNHYNFQGQMNSLRVIAQSSINLTQIINSYLKRMSRPNIRKAAEELRCEYQQLYQKADYDKLSAIKTTLNLLAKEQVTNVDELFMALAFQVNTFYRFKHLDLEKKVPYYLQCSHCLRFVSNYVIGTKVHESKCLKFQGADTIVVPQKKKKYIDTQEKYENRQKKVPKHQQGLQVPKKLTKRQQLMLKKAEKLAANSKKEKAECQDIYDGAMNFNHLSNEMFYFEDNDADLIRKGDFQTMIQVEEIHFAQGIQKGENEFFK